MALQTPAAIPSEDTTPQSTPHTQIYSTVSGPLSGSSLGALERFAPVELIERISEDWFERSHAIAPILYRRRYIRQLRDGLVDTNPVFCGLVISVCAATLSTLPRKNYAPVTLNRCISFIDNYRLLPCGISNPTCTVEYSIAMYNMGVAISALSPIGSRDLRAFHAVSESATTTRYLLYCCMADLDFVDQQLLKRLFWLLFAGAM